MHFCQLSSAAKWLVYYSPSCSIYILYGSVYMYLSVSTFCLYFSDLLLLIFSSVSALVSVNQRLWTLTVKSVLGFVLMGT